MSYTGDSDEEGESGRQGQGNVGYDDGDGEAEDGQQEGGSFDFDSDIAALKERWLSEREEVLPYFTLFYLTLPNRTYHTAPHLAKAC